ncbi:ABC transporter permease [Nocardioides rotundus]|uniref:ABC transporter permease n=1 Tax=Nocardioides rotundus TaxID=1774216 RepID=UPI001CC14492|nr:ABC-2 family transporter protein [Nocardioides rotundus]UAL28420.1 ABC transporter permease [Nocardioides rotundus]
MGDLTAYRTILASRVAAQRSYGTSFRLDVVAAGLITVVEFTEVWVLFHNVDVLGGMTLAQVMLVFGLAEMTFAVADMVVGHVDELPRFLREGTLDVFYLRPLPVLAQLMTADLQLRRLARATLGLVVLVAGTVLADVDWTWDKVLLLAISIPSSVLIYAALFVAASGLQFFLIQGAETTNAFVYGGRYAGSQPASVWPGPVLAVFGLIFPVAVTGYLPAVWLTGGAGAPYLPPWAAWLAPVAAIYAMGAAMLCWRVGMRHYQGGGG